MNVLIILVDALRPDHVGCYGYPKDTSPNIDRLAGEGVRPKKFKRLALPDEYSSLVGSQKWLLHRYGLSTPKIIERVKKTLE